MSKFRRTMMRAGVCLLTAAVLVGGQALAQLEGSALEGKTVTRIEFSGLQTLNPAAVKELMATKEGGVFKREVLDADVKRLAGYEQTVRPDEPKKPPGPPRVTRPEDAAPPIPKVFKVIPSVRAELDPASGGVVVRVVAEENRRVFGLTFRGAVEFTREELLPIMRTRAGNLVDDFTLELDRQELLRYYRDKGFHYAEVSFQKTSEPLGDVVIFKITEGAEVKIRSVTFEGIQGYTKEDLLKEMPFTEEPGFLSSKEFVYEQVKRDVVQLTNFYRGHGYRDAQVTLLDWRPNPAHDEVNITISVEEGPLYTIRAVRFEGLSIFSVDDVLLDWKSIPGTAYEPNFNLRRDIDALESRYQTFGYTEVQVRDASVIGLEGSQVDVVIEVSEGDITYVGEVVIRGNLETQDRILRREIDLVTGEALDMNKMRDAKSRIRALRYWEPTRGVDTGTPAIPVQEYEIYRDAYVSLRETKRSNVKDIVIDVEEADTGSLRFAAGVASNSGFIGDITYTKTNFDPTDFPESFGDIFDAFTGGGQFLVLSFQPGTIVSRWRASWGNPRVFDSPYAVAGEVYRNFYVREDWDENRFGGSVRVGRSFGRDFRSDLTLRDELVEVEDIDGDAPQLVFDFQGENELVSLTLDMRLSRVNDIIDPTSGFVLRGSFEYAGLWGDIDYNKALLSGEHYFDLYEDDALRHHVLQLTASAGWEKEAGDSRDIPVYERFFAGGSSSIRGFRFRGVGPRENDNPIGGKALWVTGAEYQFPLVADSIRGVAFLDAGTVALDWSDSDISNVRIGGGFGLRIVIPFLSDRPVALDFGFPIRKDDEDETQIISFSFGRYF